MLGEHRTGLDAEPYHPPSLAPYHRLADVEADRGNLDAAKDWIRKAVEESGRLDVMTVQFDLACRMKDRATAEEAMERVRTLEGTGHLWCQMLQVHGAAFFPQSDYLTLLERAIDAFPQSPEPRLAYTRLLRDQDRHAEALPHWYALAMMGVPEGCYCLAVVAFQSGRTDEALKWAAAAVEMDPINENAQKLLENLSQN